MTPFTNALANGEKAGMQYALGLPRRAPVNVAGAALGQRAGSSLEFNDYREYEPGDDLRHIDWNAYARSDQLMVKLFREEVTPHLDILIDGSRSMNLAESRKAEATMALAAFFAAAAANAGYSHRASLLAENIRPIANGTARPVRWEGIDFDSTTNPAEIFQQQAPNWRARGMRVLLSDLLWLGDPLMLLSHMAERAAGVVIVQVLAAADAHPPPHGNLRLTDAETDEVQDVYVDATAVKRYGDNLTRHQQNWHRACRQAGALLTTVIAERILDDWRLDELVAAEVLKIV